MQTILLYASQMRGLSRTQLPMGQCQLDLATRRPCLATLMEGSNCWRLPRTIRPQAGTSVRFLC